MTWLDLAYQPSRYVRNATSCNTSITHRNTLRISQVSDGPNGEFTLKYATFWMNLTHFFKEFEETTSS